VTDRELDKNAARRLAIIRHAREVTGNVAPTCRYYGISRQVFYRRLRRYEAEGLAGLRDRLKRPAHCPHETPSEVVAKIIYLRRIHHFTVPIGQPGCSSPTSRSYGRVASLSCAI